MRSILHAVFGIGGTDDGCSCELRDSNVVRMPVTSLGTEREDDVGLNSTDMRNNVANCILGRDFINGSIVVAKDRDLADPEYRRCSSQLRFSNTANFNGNSARTFTGMMILAEDPRLELLPGEVRQEGMIRFRTLGDFPLTGAIPSQATTLEEVIAELEIATVSERQGRAIDRDQSGSMEKKKREGYF